MSSRLLRAPLAAAALVLVGLPPAFALEPEAVADALDAALTQGSNVAATYSAAHADGADVVIEGLTVSRLSADQTLHFDKVVVTTPAKGDKGLFQSPLISFTGGTLTGESRGTIGAAQITDATVFDAKQSKRDMLGGAVLFSTAEATDIHVTRQMGPGEVTIDRISAETGNVVDDLPQDNKGTIENLTLSSDLFAGGAFTPATIGYDKLAFDVSWDSSRDIAAKTMTIRDFTIHIRDGGDLSVQGVMGNLPDPRALDDSGGASKASKAEVHNLTIRYQDNSLAGRILDMLAKRQGLTREEYTQQLTAALPFLLLTLNNPNFQSQVSGAIQGFLKDPHSFTIQIEPDSPVSGSELLSLLKSSPGTVPDRLKASVTANVP